MFLVLKLRPRDANLREQVPAATSLTVLHGMLQSEVRFVLEALLTSTPHVVHRKLSDVNKAHSSTPSMKEELLNNALRGLRRTHEEWRTPTVRTHKVTIGLAEKMPFVETGPPGQHTKANEPTLSES